MFITALMCITELIIDLNIQIHCDSTRVACSVYSGSVPMHKTIFNLILFVEIYSWSQDGQLSKKLTGHFGTRTLNSIPALL